MTHAPHPAAGASALQILAQLRSGALAADELARATLAHIASEDAAVGAFVCTLDADSAAAEASRLSGPLRGLPVAVKDIFETRDLPTAYGSALYVARPAACDAAVVSLLRHAGALVIGKSTTTEFAFLHPTATRNPKAPGRTPGGSSAGSAAAVAAGLVPLAVGTQTGGSVIRPASYNGVVGYKPSFGWLPTVGLKCFSWSLDTVGLFARDVADMAVFAQALTGRTLAPSPAPRGATWVVGVPEAYPWGEITPSAARALAHGCRALEAAGCELRRCTLPPWAADAFKAHDTVQGFEAVRAMSWELAHQADALSPTLRDYLQGAGRIEPAEYEAAQALTAVARAEAAEWLDGFDVLLTPSAPDQAPVGYDSTGVSTFNRAWTLLGVPCISVPGAVGVDGLPMGLQLIAPPGADARVLQVAALLERSLAGVPAR